jgi:hypothetical protein
VRFAGLLVAALITAACAQPDPSPTQTASPSPAPVTQPSSATPSPAATRTPVPTPVPTLALHGIEVFPGGADTWAMAATVTNAGEIARVEVLRSITHPVEIYAECVGPGTLTVNVTASPPPELPAATPYSLTTFDLPCPDAQSVSFGGSAPAGWFVAGAAVPSDPSIVYQILIATAIR